MRGGVCPGIRQRLKWGLRFAAQRAASIDHPALKARGLSEGSKRAKRTAVKHLGEPDATLLQMWM